MNASVPGSHHHHEPSKKHLHERLKELFKCEKLLANDIRILWKVLRALENKEESSIDRATIAEMHRILEGRAIEFHHKVTLADIIAHLEKIAYK